MLPLSLNLMEIWRPIPVRGQQLEAGVWETIGRSSVLQ
jgi:hypothetical protein